MSSVQPLVRVVDDDESVRRSVGELLRSVGFSVATYGSAQDFLSSDEPGAPGCLVLDVHLPGLTGLDLQQELLGTERALPIIFLTGLGDIPMSVRAIKSGAVEFLTKPFDTRALVEAVRHAVEKDREERIERKGLRELQARYESLTPRECEVMQRITVGRMNKQIAAEFGTSEPTVKEQRAQVMQKMQAGSLVELALMARRLGLLRRHATR
jgi:FixJ family two-component response regulator